MIHNFETSLEDGLWAETQLDNWYSQWFEIIPVPMPLQRQGVDRLYKKDGQQFMVEYKKDFKSEITGNVFIETISVDNQNKPGWAIYSRADVLVTYTPNVVYVVSMTLVKSKLEEWGDRYRIGRSLNNGYWTHGILVPIEEYAQYHLGNLEDVWQQFT